ncbi:MAG: hypothetical protein A3D31_09885 [Candidatus Fluviicola riflensis]|nr:MAG: hypothetical protein CHH17_14300 [Candidatus Fluviicola riflensis]OGS77316.1 MAG: hypothetical protein A3D31_09885 [Candidatus Fluviicola riflensis]OGS82251.1 MAG: hypothetical protein A2724_18830 [Fluviicola sp. RIFCSPHIGHO2_01_FULL_43_53]OGS87944.1 MAG: hypothetical protein A3E30_16265 [Fluviicola sp. RIFCSPHIGHO2_12_FULL_43_24]
MKQLISLILCLLAGTILFAQSGKLKRADNYYNTLAYALAAEQYEELLGSEVDSPQLKAKLAHCYFQMGNTLKSETHYASMVSSGEASSEDVYNYAQSLKENGKYAESDQWMNKFAGMKQNDVRATEFVNRQNYLELIEKQGNHFSIKSLNVNTVSTDFGGYPSADQETVYFVTSRNDPSFVNHVWTWKNERFLDLYAGKSGQEQEIANPELITRRVNSRYHEGPLCFSANGQRVYFTRNNISKGKKRNDQQGIQNLKLYMADVQADGSWENETEFALNSRDYSVGHPSLSPDGKYLYFASDMPGGFGGADIYRIAIAADGSFGQPENLGKEINTEGQDMFPWMSQDGYLFFSSDGRVGLGGLDVFVMLPNDKGGISKVLNVGKPVNSQKDDFAFTMLNDNKQGYFSSNRDGGKGEDDIYAYLLTKPFKIDLMVAGIATEKGTGMILPGTEIILQNETGEIIETIKSDNYGAYSFNVEPEFNYRIVARQTDYYDDQVQFSTKNLAEGTEKIQQDIDLEKDPGLALYLLVTDGTNKSPLSGVKLTIADNGTKNPFIDQVTGETGDVLKGLADKKVGEQLSYTITLSKEGYLSKTVQFTTQIIQPGVINVHEKLDLTLDKIEVGIDLATLIDIKPIYFDYAKFNIRKDAAIELEKIVKVMNDYPTMQIELGSHTDCRGSIQSNESLSDKRAKASAAYIKSKIKNPERIYGKGYGEAKLKNDCGCEGPVKSTCSEESHQENRRTEFIIIKM